MWESLILHGSVMGLLPVLVAGGLDKEARQSLDDDPFLLVVELLPQVRLRNRDVVEAQNQLRHGPPGLPQIVPASWGRGAGEPRGGCEDAVGHRVSPRAEEPV